MNKIKISNFSNVYVLVFLFLFLFSCAGLEVERDKYTPEEMERMARYGVDDPENSSWGDFFGLIDRGPESTFTGIDNILWNVSLEKLSFIPLASVDKSSGTIITDWHSLSDAERMKISVFIFNNELNESSLDIKIFKETLSNSQWVSAERNSKLEIKIKDNILTTAQNLKIAAEL
jgi:hypothetical protein